MASDDEGGEAVVGAVDDDDPLLTVVQLGFDLDDAREKIAQLQRDNATLKADFAALMERVNVLEAAVAAPVAEAADGTALVAVEHAPAAAPTAAPAATPAAAPAAPAAAPAAAEDARAPAEAPAAAPAAAEGARAPVAAPGAAAPATAEPSPQQLLQTLQPPQPQAHEQQAEEDTWAVFERLYEIDKYVHTKPIDLSQIRLVVEQHDGLLARRSISFNKAFEARYGDRLIFFMSGKNKRVKGLARRAQGSPSHSDHSGHSDSE